MRLELIVAFPSLTLLINFNSIKVRLEHKLQDSIFDLSVFQFHKGAIRTICVMQPVTFHVNFNSIKVRLEREFGICDSKRTKFQFHKGAIRTNFDFLKDLYIFHISIP